MRAPRTQLSGLGSMRKMSSSLRYATQWLVEEERLPSYNPQNFLPVKIGQVFRNKYEVLAKLGYGTSSTVWLVKDIKRWRFTGDKFYAVKVLNREYSESTPSELSISDHLRKAYPNHEGYNSVRTILDSFMLSGPNGNHLCFVYDPMRETITRFQQRCKGEVIPINLLKLLLRRLLNGLNYIHKCQVIHTDLKPDNILLGIEDDTILAELIEEEKKYHSLLKQESDRVIYASRQFGDIRGRGAPGPPKITDFSHAIRGGFHNHPIQSNLYQAPEVILCAGWSYSADIWNLGVLIWDLMEGRPLFNAVHPSSSTYAEEKHLSEMISLLGPPPIELLQLGKATDKYFLNGNPIYYDEVDNITRLEDTVMAIEDGTAEKEGFLRFVRRALTWMPDQRATAEELLSDPWLKS